MLQILIIIMYLAHSLHLEKAQTLLWMEQTIQPKSKLVTWKTFQIMILSKSLMRPECRFAVLMEKFMEFLPMDGFPESGVMLRFLRNVE